MKVTKCDCCGYEISMKTGTCPSCGEKIGIKVGGIRKFLMRIIFFLMALYIIYSAFKFVGEI